MAHPFSLRLPYIAKLDTTINPGQSLIVRGTPNGDRFDINLQVDPFDSVDIVFQMSCRVKEKFIILNTKERGEWGKEEKYKCNLEKGIPFSIRIRCHENRFECYVDGKDLCEYRYRTSLHSITHVDVNGQLSLNAVGWEGNYYSVPYKAIIPGHFGPGRKMFLVIVPDDDLHMSVNFLVGEDIAFHFNPRFAHKKTVNNSQFGGSWGKEEILPRLPFEKKKSVDLMFICEKDQFVVFANGERFCTYAHRIDPNQITGLNLVGKMELQVVNFE